MKIAFVGNCHADVLKRVLGYVYRHDRSLQLRYFATQSPFTDADRAFIAESDMLVQQIADFSNVASSLDTGKARIVWFPLLIAQFLWPFNTKNHPNFGQRVPDRGDPDFFVFVLTDGQVINLMKERGIGPNSADAEIEALLDAYLALDYAKLTNLDRQHDFSRAKMHRAAETVGYDLWSPIDRDFRSVQTFLTALHPSSAVMLTLCREVLPRCGFPMEDAEILEAFDEAYEGEYPFTYEAPLHPSVIRHFGLNVPGHAPAYRFWCDGTVTTRELARRIVTFDARQPVRQAFALAFEGERLEQRIAELEAMIPTQRGNPTFFLRLGNLRDRLGHQEEALRLYVDGLRAAPGHTGLARRVTLMFGRMGLFAAPELLDEADTIGFGVDERGRGMLLGSWNRIIDPTAAWLEGHTGALRFRFSSRMRQADQAVDLAFRARAFGRPQCFMQARIYANGREVGFWSFNAEEDNDIRSVRLSPEIAATSAINLSFFVDQPVRPIDLGLSADIRSFGIGISQMMVSIAQ